MQNINIGKRLKISGFLDFKIAFNKFISLDNQIDILLKHLEFNFNKLFEITLIWIQK